MEETLRGHISGTVSEGNTEVVDHVPDGVLFVTSAYKCPTVIKRRKLNLKDLDTTVQKGKENKTV